MDRIYCERAGKACYGDSELPLLFEISNIINNSMYIKKALDPIMELIANYMFAERTLLSVLNRELSSIYIEAGYGLSDEEKRKGKYLIGEGITGNVIKTGEAIFIEKISDAAGFVNKTRIRKTSSQEDLSFVCVPIVVKDRIAGTLSLVRKHDPFLDKEELIRILGVIGTMVTQAVRRRQRSIEELTRLRKENRQLCDELKNSFAYENIIGNSSKLKELFKLIQQVSRTQATVLIRGESGVGKELVANAVHYGSNRKKKPLIKVNCSALPESLIESELFGHERGAFTGADFQKKGRFELAEGGTIFLDEIGDLPIQSQVKILRVLQEKQFERIGGGKTINCNVRVVAATNRNLEKAIKANDFREDLYYRLNVFPIYIPPLRERINDLPLLVDHFIQKCNKKNETNIKRISSAALDMMMIYHWPGNIRELENCIERAAIVSDDGVIDSQHLPPTLQTAQSSGTVRSGTLENVLDKVEKQLIIETLASTKGNVLKSAKQLGISNRKLGLRITKHDIDVSKFKLLKD
ncbi:sigma 54-interacting transcriptional regulator [Flammeovirgaceae bacterium SG7u.111]|nr:sigma 54-interacting transcriptional regulator [Flammeovirgaceae bacterium SG7u.132]WPO37570.1 sigma 54-interacting transcriptional regulator [Flammeovirgaceae bacterium SG7u.111]